jgi:ribosomal protein S8
MLKNFISNNNIKKKNYKKTKSILTDQLIENKSYNFVVLVGYVILGLVFCDYLNLLIPPQLFNPNWELETLGKIIETSWILLLGFMLVFFRTQERAIRQRELKLLSFFSWITLVVAICYFLAAPLLISDALRINQTNKAQLNTQLTNQNQQVEQVFTQINQASKQDIDFFRASNQLPNSSSSIQDVKKQLVNVIQQKQKTATEQLKRSFKNQQRQLFKITFKWVIGTIISGIAFVTVWQYTSWARNIKI